jgi:hypothetical protein
MVLLEAVCLALLTVGCVWMPVLKLHTAAPTLLLPEGCVPWLLIDQLTGNRLKSYGEHAIREARAMAEGAAVLWAYVCALPAALCSSSVAALRRKFNRSVAAVQQAWMRCAGAVQTWTKV